MGETVDPALAELAGGLAAGFGHRGRPRKAVRGACAVAVEFWTWRRLAHEGLSDEAAAELMVGAVAAAAAP